MPDARALTPVASGSALAPPFADRFGAIGGFLRQPAVERAKPALAALAAVSLAGLAYLALQSPTQAPLYAGLADGDKAAIGEALQASGIAYSIDPVTGTLNVDSDMIHQARIALAGQGLPKAQPSGGALMADLPMGSSRAVEGETLRAVRESDLARTIEAIDAVRTAKVHIGAPDPSPFVRDAKAATASVLLTLEGGRSLGDGQVQAIRFLIASSVPGLDVQNVSVIDQRGALLSETASNPDMKMFQLQMKVEDRLRAAVDRLIGPVLGANNYSVEVHADVDLTESQATRETYPKDDRALRSEDIRRSVNDTAPLAAGGIPGALSNLPPDNAALTNTSPAGSGTPTPGRQASQSNENAQRAYEVGREISVTHQPQGQVRRVTVAVALHQGKKAFTQADLTKFDALVKSAVGFDAERGDLVAISQRPFVRNVEEETPLWLQPWFMPAAQKLAALLAALAVFFFVGRPMIRNAKARAAERNAERIERDALLTSELIAATSRDGDRALPAPGEPITLEMIESASSYEARAGLVRNFVRQDPNRAAIVVRQLMQEGARG